MLKKLTLLAISVGALLAIAAPAAQATGPLITNEEGETPTYLTATSTNTITHLLAGTIECTTTILTIHLTENANTTVKGHGTGTMEGRPNNPEPEKHAGYCVAFGGFLLDFTDVTLTDIHFTKHTGITTGTASLSYTFDFGFGGECTFGTPITRVAVTRTSTDTIKIHGEVERTGGNAFCPTGSGPIAGDFTLEEDANGEHIVIG